MERGNANLGTRKKNFEKARRNAEREEEMKERRHASREEPAGTRAQLWVFIWHPEYDTTVVIELFSKRISCLESPPTPMLS